MRFTDENSYVVMKFRVTPSESLTIKAALRLTEETFSDVARMVILAEANRRLGEQHDDQ